MTTHCRHLLLYCNSTTQKNNKKNWREGRELAFKPSLYPFTFGSHFKCVVLVAISSLPLLAITSAFPLQAPSSAISLQALSSFANGVNAKWGEVGKRGEVSTREVVGGKNFEVEKRLKKPKTLSRGGCVFGSSPKRLEQPHPQLMHWWLLVHSSPKQVPCRFSLNLPLFGLGPSSKDFGTN